MSGVLALYAPLCDETTRKRRTDDLTRALKHRGPDYQGEWFDEVVPFGMGHRRLAITDLSPEARQPMISQSGRYVISFDGDVFNAPDLRDTLVGLGAHIRGRSDSEVILAAIDTWGLNTAVQKINGTFALVLWDRQTKEIHIIRDRLGEKPLYIGWAGSDLLIASELRAFTAHPDFARDLSVQNLPHYFHLGFIPAPLTIFRDVYMVTPGSRLLLRPATLSRGQDLRPFMTPYWSSARVIDDGRLARAHMASLSFDARRNATENLMDTCVRDRMFVDVPLGAFLSGDVASSLVTAIAQKNLPRRLSTYTIGLADKNDTALARARGIAHHLGTDHHECLITPSDILNALPDFAHAQDSPVADMSLLPMYLLSRFARNETTVALCGTGGNTFFGGRPHHTQLDQFIKTFHWLPIPIRTALHRILGTLGPGVTRLFHPHDPAAQARMRTLASLLMQNDLPQMYEFLIGLGEENAITTPQRPAMGYPFRQSTSWPTGLDIPEWPLFADMIHDMPNHVFLGTDQVTMAASLEMRAPLADPRIMAHAWTLPLRDKIHRGHGNVMLRHVLSRYIPNELMPPMKNVSPLPLGDLLSGALKPWVQDTLALPALYDTFGLDPNMVRQLLAHHIDGTRPAPHTLWRLLMLNTWATQWLTR